MVQERSGRRAEALDRGPVMEAGAKFRFVNVLNQTEVRRSTAERDAGSKSSGLGHRCPPPNSISQGQKAPSGKLKRTFGSDQRGDTEQQTTSRSQRQPRLRRRSLIHLLRCDIQREHWQLTQSEPYLEVVPFTISFFFTTNDTRKSYQGVLALLNNPGVPTILINLDVRVIRGGWIVKLYDLKKLNGNVKVHLVCTTPVHNPENIWFLSQVCVQISIMTLHMEHASEPQQEIFCRY